MSSRQFLERLILALPTLLGVSIIVFFLMRVAPGDPITMMIPPGASEADIEQLRAHYGLDLPIGQQYLVWLGNTLSGDFGTSISLRQDVLSLILNRLPATLELALMASIFAIIICLLLSLSAAYFKNFLVKRMVDSLASTGQAVPDFLWGLGFILLLGVVWPLFPISGRIDPRLDHDLVTQFYLFESLLRFDLAMLRELLQHMLLPAMALALPMAGIMTRLLKHSLEEVDKEDYIIMSRARGFSRWTILRRDALPNALLPTLTLGGVQLTFLLGGTVLIEKLFSYPGIGNMAIGAVIQRDLPLIQGLILTFAVLFIVINFLVDLCQIWLNPRLRDE